MPPPDPNDWTVSSSYDYMDNLSSPEIGWECLRRNDDYRQDYTRLVETTDETAPLIDDMRHQWGLRFPGRAPLQSP